MLLMRPGIAISVAEYRTAAHSIKQQMFFGAPEVFTTYFNCSILTFNMGCYILYIFCDIQAFYD